jgi:SlyX protein
MYDTIELQPRVVELETRMAFQERVLQELSDIVARQQAELDHLKQALKTAQERLRTLQPGSPVADRSEETPPPHY